MIQPFNELTRNNFPFEWTDQCQKSLCYIKQVITTSLISAYADPEKQYYLFPDSCKHSWSGILAQYAEQEWKDGTKLHIPHSITYQSGTSLGSQNSWRTLSKEAYAICMSFWKMVFYLEKVHIMIQCDHAPLCTFIYSVTKDDKVSNWP